ncbi:MAG: O-antigen ligase family protein [Lachnospiraceae bacterium]|nr:O-antigen ligase family protein [Lachnospiraceae bacterium]
MGRKTHGAVRPSRKNARSGQREGFHDALVPILLMLCVLPLIVRLSEYDCGYGEYLWYAGSTIRTELYSYHKSRCFVVLAVLCALILPFRFLLYREKCRPWKTYLPLLVYAVAALLSAFLSQNFTASMVGNLDSFENVWVLLGYAVVSFYAYQILETEKDYRIVWYGILAVSIAMAVIGILQVFKINFLEYEWGQKLVMTAEQYAVYGGEVESAFTGNNVYLTLYNPNYAGIFLTMLASVSGVMALTEKMKKRKLAYTALFLLMLLLIWFTYSRSTLVALAAGAVVLAACLGGGQVKRLLCRGIPAVLVLAVLLIAVDGTQGFYYLNRMLDSPDIEPLEKLVTTEDAVELVYDGQDYVFTIEDETVRIRDAAGETLSVLTEGKSVVLHDEDGVEASCSDLDGETELVLYLADTSMDFVYSDDGYYYINTAGNLDQITEIPAVDFHGLEYLGSGRVYIWSRVLPLLKRYLLIGSGPDTFAESFPQNDYAGKLIYSNNTGMIIEKGHNDFLTKWVQTGMISSVACVIFYVLLLRKGIRSCRGSQNRSAAERLRLGCLVACACYIAGMCFNDSTIQTGPMFWLFAGVVLSGCQPTPERAVAK